MTIIVVGIAYNFTSDFVDFILGGINDYEGTPLANQMDADSIQGAGFLMVVFKMILVPSLFVIMYFAWVMAQRPLRPW